MKKLICDERAGTPSLTDQGQSSAVKAILQESQLFLEFGLLGDIQSRFWKQLLNCLICFESSLEAALSVDTSSFTGVSRQRARQNVAPV